MKIKGTAKYLGLLFIALFSSWNKRLGWAFIAIASITSCTHDTEHILTQECEIRLTSEITPSRAEQDLQSTQIVENQQIGVTIVGAQKEHDNIAWNAGPYGALTNTGSPVYWGESEVTITAYHPYISSWTDNVFSVNTDQSTNAGYLNSDLLWASTIASITAKPISLIFVHKLAKINVVISGDKDLSGTTICICGTHIATGFNPVTGLLTDVEGTIADITAGITTNNAYTASAIIVPQAIEKGTKFIKLTNGNKDYYYTLPERKEYQSGHSYNYTLKIDDSNMENPIEVEEFEW